MPGQPTDMAGMLRSVVETANDPATNKVFNTLATVPMNSLTTNDRIAATAYQAHVLALGNGIGNMAPGTPMPMRGQTDIYFRDMDHDGTFGLLANHVHTIGRRLR